MDAILEFIKGPPGIVLAFIGIALAYIFAGIFSRNNGTDGTILIRFLFVAVGGLYIYFAYLVYEMGTVEGVDASRVLAYLGIGIGMSCTAWAEWPRHRHWMWIIMIPGLLFQLIGLLLILEFHNWF